MNETQTQTPTSPPEVMTVDDLAAYLQVSKRSVYNMASAGEVPAVKIAGQWRFFKPTVDRWLEEQSKLTLEDHGEV